MLHVDNQLRDCVILIPLPLITPVPPPASGFPVLGLSSLLISVRTYLWMQLQDPMMFPKGGI